MNTTPLSAAALMPKEAWQRQILHERAQHLAKAVNLSDTQEREYEYLQVKLNNDGVYGIAQTDLDEVIYAQSLTRLPWLPSFISGVVAWKGIILTVLDSNYLCLQQSSQITELSRIIVVRHQQHSVGLLVNSIANFCSYKTSHLNTDLLSPIAFNKAYFGGLLDYTVTFLNVAAILTDPALKIDQPLV